MLGNEHSLEPGETRPAETELYGVPPRNVRFKTKTLVTRYVILNLAIAGFIIAQWLVSKNLRELRELEASGVVASALITDKTESHGKTTTYRVYYRFTPEGQHEAVSDSSQVSSIEYSNVSIGENTPVTYMPTDPDEHRYGFVKAERVARAQKSGTLGLLFGGLLAVGLMSAGEWYLRSRLRLLREGIATVGEVVDHKIIRSSRSTTYKLVYRYWMPDGELFYGEESVSRKIFNTIGDSAPLTVLYLANYPKNGVPYITMDEVEIIDSL